MVVSSAIDPICTEASGILHGQCVSALLTDVALATLGSTRQNASTLAALGKRWFPAKNL